MDKSYVTLEQNVCIVCAKAYDTGTLLLDKRLRKSFDMYTITGWGMCPECSNMKTEGYIALVGVDPEKSDVTISTQNLNPNDAYRTGVIMHMKKRAWKQIINAPIPEDGICFIEPDAIEMLRKWMHPEDRVASI